MNALFQTAKPALLVVTTSKGETLISNKLHNHCNHDVLIIIYIRKSQEYDSITINNESDSNEL